MKGKKKGITLISLVITIVIMLILAGVVINLIIGKNGVFNKSQEAVSIYNDKKEQEAKDMKEEEKIYSLYIQDLDDLIAFRDSVNAGNTYADTTVYLVNDIDMKGSVDNQWISIASADYSVLNDDGETFKFYPEFEGNFEGNGHTLSNLYIDCSNKLSNGLFGSVQYGAIQNLTVLGTLKKTDTKNNSSNDISGIICTANEEKIDNCVSYVNMDLKNINKNKYEFIYVGGIVAYGFSNKISNCTNYGNINADDAKVGGIAGISCQKSIINNCYNYGKLSTNMEKELAIYNCIGGITSYNEYNSLILNSDNYADVNQTAFNNNNDFNGAGGIVGFNEGLVYGCCNQGNIMGNITVGGITGYNAYEEITDETDGLKMFGVYNSCNTGIVKGDLTKGNYIGGISGYSATSIVNCYNIGKVEKAAGEYYNSIVGEQGCDGESYDGDGNEVIKNLKDCGIAKVDNCYALDSSELNNHIVTVIDVNNNVISDTSNIEIIRKDETYMKSEAFVHDLNDDIWQYRFNNYPTLKAYSGDVSNFFNK